MRARNAERDQGKYEQLGALHRKWSLQHETQVAEWNAGCAANGQRPVVRLSTEQGLQNLTDQLIQLVVVNN
jgi:hypothetical protein